MSNLWVTMHALPYLKYPPKDIALIDCGSSINTLNNITTIKYVMFDDASYSGSQISEIIEGMSNEETLKNPHLIVPFMTDASCAKIRKATEGNCWIAEHKKMASLQHIFTKKEELKIIVDAHKGYPDGFANNLTLTYFDHKVADAFSLSPLISRGYKIDDNKTGISFIENPDTPYKNKDWWSRKKT